MPWCGRGSPCQSKPPAAAASKSLVAIGPLNGVFNGWRVRVRRLNWTCACYLDRSHSQQKEASRISPRFQRTRIPSQAFLEPQRDAATGMMIGRGEKFSQRCHYCAFLALWHFGTMALPATTSHYLPLPATTCHFRRCRTLGLPKRGALLNQGKLARRMAS